MATFTPIIDFTLQEGSYISITNKEQTAGSRSNLSTWQEHIHRKTQTEDLSEADIKDITGIDHFFTLVDTVNPLFSSEKTCERYSVHGLRNECYYCYANSAYQLFANIPSLRFFLSRLKDPENPSRYDALKAYSERIGGREQ
jgi:ubiquitin C-terminal hydrolase